MASNFPTTTITTTASFEELDGIVRNEAHKVLNKRSMFWSGVEWFLDFLRTNVKIFFTEKLENIPIVGIWAARIGTTVTEFVFTVLGTLINFLRIVIGSPTFMKCAHETAMKAWDANIDNGLLAQTYAYGKKMAGYFLEIIKQCFERAIKAHGLEMGATEKAEISSLLDGLLPK